MVVDLSGTPGFAAHWKFPQIVGLYTSTKSVSSNSVSSLAPAGKFVSHNKLDLHSANTCITASAILPR